MKEWRKYTPEERHNLERFEILCRDEVARNAHHPPEKARAYTVNALVIGARHFSRDSGDGLGYRRRLLEIAAEATGVPLVKLPQPDDSWAWAWPPARGEVGWPPYEESPEAWANAT